MKKSWPFQRLSVPTFVPARPSSRQGNDRVRAQATSTRDESSLSARGAIVARVHDVTNTPLSRTDGNSGDIGDYEPSTSRRTAQTSENVESAEHTHNKEDVLSLPNNVPVQQRGISRMDLTHSTTWRDDDSDTEDEEELRVAFSYKQPMREKDYVMSRPYHDVAFESLLPESIVCSVEVRFNEVSLSDASFRITEFVWTEASSYTQLLNRFQEVKRTFVQRGVCKPSHEVFVKNASFYLKGGNGEHVAGSRDSITIIAHEGDDYMALAETVNREICGFIHQYPFERFALNFLFDCSSIERLLMSQGDKKPWLPNSGKFQLAMRAQYKEQMSLCRGTINQQRYLSHADQRVLITPANVRRLVEDDAFSEPLLTETEKGILIHEILVRPASILQAVCVFDCVPMRFLYHFLCEEPHLDQKHSDSLDSLNLDSPNTCNNALCIKYRQSLVEHIYQFNPEIMKPDHGHLVRNEHAIVPIRHNASKPSVLGVGAFSTVYEVDIDPQHQLISPDITRTYALKTFGKNQRDKEAFDREIKMLLQLSRYLQHSHLLVHITSWEQNSRYYILYEKAQSNLRTHMQLSKGGDLSGKRVLWFLFQLRGLSDAVRRLHFFHEAGAGNKKARNTSIVGVHYDIKPENILIFNHQEGFPTLKLGDFGSAKFFTSSRYDSPRGTSKIRGTYTYIGPESQRDVPGKMTRPFDMWALGCVYLELLLWFLGIEKPDGVNDFADMRLDNKYNSRAEEYDYFWQRQGLGVYTVNGAVTFALDLLQHQVCRDMQPFQNLIATLRGLLVVQPAERLNARDLHNVLDTICFAAAFQLQSNPTVYTELFQANCASNQLVSKGLFGPDGTLAEHRSNDLIIPQ